jgi:hypothetical protein
VKNAEAVGDVGGREALVLPGTSLYPATGAAAGRQARAMERLRALSPLRPVNLQFADGAVCEMEGFETMRALRHDSTGITGMPGARKPLASELFTCLARLAVQRGARYFLFTNADITFTPEAFDRIRRGDHRAYVFTRTDVDPGSGRDVEPLIYGADVFAVDARWWLAHRSGFRPYIVGEGGWDNVYAAQLLCRAGGILLNRDPLVRHEIHEIAWRESPFSRHNGYLAALDRLHFTRWVTYVDRLTALRANAGGFAPLEAELRLQHAVFRDWKPSLGERALQAFRVGRLVLRHGWR